MGTSREATPTETASTAASAEPGRPRLIVGVGASAGGLEAFEQFFRDIPAISGLAFVLVQHLDPAHVSALCEILSRYAAIPVIEATDAMVVAADHVYVIPPNRDMTILRGALRLSLPEMPRGQRMPIDMFLRALADDQAERAVGVILSGSGTDGTQGLRAILGAGGTTYAQDPASAKYDSMPSSAIGAGYAGNVLPPDRIVAAILAGANRLISLGGTAPLGTPPVLPPGLGQLLLVLRNATGHDFSLYKKTTLLRRIERRMAQLDVSSIDQYTRYLKKTPAEIQSLFKELLINVSSFFRDPEAFATLKAEVLGNLVAHQPDGYVVRVWIAGCASGEEAYSIAILLRELMDETQQAFKVQLYSTDLDDDAIATARAGLYPQNIAADVTPERLRRFFVKEEAGYRIKTEIREMVVFAVQSVIKDPPFTRLDLISCRNVMIYLEPELQTRLLPIFHYALRPGGALLLSPSESVGNRLDLFAPISRKWKIYRTIPQATSARMTLDVGAPWHTGASSRGQTEKVIKAKETNLGELARQALLQSFAPPSVVTDALGNIQYVYGDTGNCLRPAPGQPTLNVIDMAAEGLQLELRAALNAAAQGTPVLGRPVAVKIGDAMETICLSVRPIANQEGGQGLVLISFQPGTAPARTAKVKSRGPAGSADARRVIELQHELAYVRENLQATIEEHQAINEDYKSANEELQSTNEELQSTNEELETSKEELQSVNEELITVNAELQAKIEQLDVVQNDMKNLLDNINIGTIFLDRKLLIRRFTREAKRIFRLVGSDVGRSLADIKSSLMDDALMAQAQNVVDTLVPLERVIRTSDGEHYQARIQPYRTTEDVIDGVVLTFSDIGGRVAAETAERAARELAEGIIDAVREPMLVLDAAGRIVSAGRAFYEYFRLTPETTVGRSIYSIGGGRWNLPALRELLETVLPGRRSFDGFVIDGDFPGVGPCKLVLNARHFALSAGQPSLILLALEARPAQAPGS